MNHSYKQYNETYQTAETMRALMALDPTAPRQSLRDAVPYSAKKLDSLTRSWLSLSPEFKPQKVAAWNKPPNKEPIYPAWAHGYSSTPSLFLSPKWDKHEHWCACTIATPALAIAA